MPDHVVADPPAKPEPARRGVLASRLVYIVPLALFLVVAGYAWLGLKRDPSELPSVLIDQPIPTLALEAIPGRDRGLSNADLMGEVSLVNIFGSWCVSCRIEHPFLMDLKQRGLVPIHGINWREKSPEHGTAWLDRFGDPYTLIGADPESKGAIAFGVTGAPETFIVDATGVIRYKHTGPITPKIWDETLWPIVQRLRGG